MPRLGGLRYTHGDCAASRVFPWAGRTVTRSRQPYTLGNLLPCCRAPGVSSPPGWRAKVRALFFQDPRLPRLGYSLADPCVSVSRGAGIART